MALLITVVSALAFVTLVLFLVVRRQNKLAEAAPIERDFENFRASVSRRNGIILAVVFPFLIIMQIVNAAMCLHTCSRLAHLQGMTLWQFIERPEEPFSLTPQYSGAYIHAADRSQMAELYLVIATVFFFVVLWLLLVQPYAVRRNARILKWIEERRGLATK